VHAAADGFHAVEAGFMIVLMERETSMPAPPSDYRVIAMRLVATGERELQEAGAEGFRISVLEHALAR
jgi:hypothetical protein